MYKSELFIKMADCPEIQELFKVEDGNWIYFKKMPDICHTLPNPLSIGSTVYFDESLGCYGILGGYDDRDYLEREDFIWLPRQDQLQEMVREDETVHSLLIRFASWHTPFGVLVDEYAYSFTSMEQLWLAFVMKEKYNKVWNGERWE